MELLNCCLNGADTVFLWPQRHKLDVFVSKYIFNSSDKGDSMLILIGKSKTDPSQCGSELSLQVIPTLPS